jgi:hypothetical protein
VEPHWFWRSNDVEQRRHVQFSSIRRLATLGSRDCAHNSLKTVQVGCADSCFYMTEMAHCAEFYCMHRHTIAACSLDWGAGIELTPSSVQQRVHNIMGGVNNSHIHCLCSFNSVQCDLDIQVLTSYTDSSVTKLFPYATVAVMVEAGGAYFVRSYSVRSRGRESTWQICDLHDCERNVCI